MKALISLENALAEADRCVKCGLCLPYCPTYGLYKDEGESPRGRIALAEALLRGQLAPDDTLQRHIDRCLLCRACETHCPSGVRYSTILDSARAQLRKADRGVAVTAPDSPLMTVAAHLARALHLPGLRGRLARALPIEDKAPAPGTYPPANPPRGPIGLLLGCVTRTQQPGALLAAIRLLNALDYEVVVPAAQECCGALAAHQGDLATAQRQIEANRSAFAGLDGMVSLASGCSLHLAEHLPERSPEDIVTFLTRRLRTRPLPFDRPDGPIALHIPCTLANGLKAPNSLLELLGNLSDTELHTLGQTGGCCGAAGTHLLTQREQAERLREPFLEQLKALKPRYLLTANIGCAMHLAEGAMSEGIGLEVLHPVELLARLLNESRDLGK